MYSLMDLKIFKNHCIGTKLVFVFFPKKCYFTKRILWLKNAYKQTAMYTGPGEPIFEYRYYNKSDFLVNRIKGII